MGNVAQRAVLWNDGWLFKKWPEQDFFEASYQEEGWDAVALPHIPQIEDADVTLCFQGVCAYRKHFLHTAVPGQRTILHFEAAMQAADVYCNGIPLASHQGGYLPFEVDLTPALHTGENIIAVRLDNRDDQDIPPGKAANDLDFCYFGGLYRNVWLKKLNGVAITDPVSAQIPAGGGIFITCSPVSREQACVHIKVHGENVLSEALTVSCQCRIRNPQGEVDALLESQGMIPSGGTMTFRFDHKLTSPWLWSPETPNLYTLETQLLVNGECWDRLSVHFGVRHIALSKEGDFLLNGVKRFLRGTNRHQQYPLVGSAASDNAQWRDALLLKKAGFDFVRLAHYPQSPAFLDACDHIGLMVMEPVPGWQWCQPGLFQQRTLQNIRDMIRRDRNHPSIVFWEVSLNETGDSEGFNWGGWSGATDDFCHQCHLAAHEEYPGDQCLTAGDTGGRPNPVKVGYDIPFSQWDPVNHVRHLDALPLKKGLVREYGDFEFGGNESTTRQARGAGEQLLLLQAWNFMWTHNYNLALPSAMGDANWVGIDYNRGYYPAHPVCECGVLDTFRLPKFAYYFYQSQRSSQQPMVFIASYWDAGPARRRLVVFSNCEQVSLSVNGRPVEIRYPDSGPDTPYLLPRDCCDPNYWMEQENVAAVQADTTALESLRRQVSEFISTQQTGFFDRSNCRHLSHPPFTFLDVPYEEGEIAATGWIGGRAVAEHRRRTPGVPSCLRLRAENQGIPLKADGADFVFLYAEVTDSNGTVVPSCHGMVHFEITGPGQGVGPSDVRLQGGIAASMLRAGIAPGIIRVTASMDGCENACLDILSKP